jgi:mono/diheme cytochrome c family protein
MKTHKGRWGRWLMAAAMVVAPALAASLSAQEPPTAVQTGLSTDQVAGQTTVTIQPQAVESGAYLFRTYCASCHGVTALGDGPLASAMRRRPPNLTEFQKRNGGVFAKDLVYQIIDGRQKVRGHGGPDMPVWGDAFLRTADAGSEAAVAARINALVAFLESIQARDTQ